MHLLMEKKVECNISSIISEVNYPEQNLFIILKTIFPELKPLDMRVMDLNLMNGFITIKNYLLFLQL